MPSRKTFFSINFLNRNFEWLRMYLRFPYLRFYEAKGISI